MTRTPRLLAILGLLALSAWGTPARAASPDRRCVGGEEARTAGDDEGPPTFTAAFRRHTVTLDVSLDGLDGAQLPMSIEDVCDVPSALKRAAAQMVGNDAIALLSAGTTVVADGDALHGAAARGPLAGADAASVRARMAPPSAWEKDEDGNALPTFSAGRITVTD